MKNYPVSNNLVGKENDALISLWKYYLIIYDNNLALREIYV